MSYWKNMKRQGHNLSELRRDWKVVRHAESLMTTIRDQGESAVVRTLRNEPAGSILGDALDIAVGITRWENEQ